MSWIDDHPLKFHEKGAREALRLITRGYQDSAFLKQVATSAGLQVGLINFNQASSLLPMPVLQRAANENRVAEFLGEVVADPASSAIHDDIWKLLDDDARKRVYAAAVEASPDFDRMASLPETTKYWINGVEGDLQKIVNAAALFHDPAILRFEPAKREAWVVRIDVDDEQLPSFSQVIAGFEEECQTGVLDLNLSPETSSQRLPVAEKLYPIEKFRSGRLLLQPGLVLGQSIF